MEYKSNIFAPGARVLIRDAEWLVRKVDSTSTGGDALSVVGLSECVKDKEAVFLTEIDDNIKALDPKETRLVGDTSSNYRDALLYMESLLRQTPPTDENLYIGHQAVIDPVPYQLDPAIISLRQPRQRILIADAVGLGKTIEAGILLSELIKRGKGKRILVLTVKSMLTQFQKEMWSRFTIPLVRLDSVGIQRIRSRIPTNHNPFFYYDKSIISIDTLKQDAEYRTHLENCYWDIIVIDEAHNVAERGSDGTSSLRSRLARLLTSRSDTLIMLSATPHDGKPRAFASLMNMLNPTAIADPDNYGPEDIKGLFVRRFKKDIKDQVASSFKERKIFVAGSEATSEEEDGFDALSGLTFAKLDRKRSGSMLFKTTLEKSLFSSPSACLETIKNRITRLKKEDEITYVGDITQLEDLAALLSGVTPGKFSKYQKLLSVIRDNKHGLGWTGKDPADRLVIFTERIETLKFLHDNLRKDLGLKDEQAAILHGTMSDIDQQAIVDAFGREEAQVRILIASDVASEGINLHFLCHKMIHFDIPWSLMVFQQRNGRIDRYGQERDPLIVYLKTESRNEKIKGDSRILELLIQKDEQAVKNIGDPAALMGVYDIEQEEAITAKALEQDMDEASFDDLLKESAVDPLAILMGQAEPVIGKDAAQARKKMPSMFGDDYTYLKASIDYVRKNQPLQADFDDAGRTVHITAPKELEARFKFLPHEVLTDDGTYILSSDRDAIKREIKRSRQEEHLWPRLHLLWEQHPILNWANDKVLAAFGRHEAPVMTLSDTLGKSEAIFIISGLIPNRKSHPVIHRWLGVRFLAGKYDAVMDFEKVLKKSDINQKTFANTNLEMKDTRLDKMLPVAVDKAYEWMSRCRQEFISDTKGKIESHTEELERLRLRQYEQLEFAFVGETSSRALDKKERERREIDRIFKEYREWIRDTMMTEDNPYIRVVAVLRGENG